MTPFEKLVLRGIWLIVTILIKDKIILGTQGIMWKVDADKYSGSDLELSR